MGGTFCATYVPPEKSRPVFYGPTRRFRVPPAFFGNHVAPVFVKLAGMKLSDVPTADLREILRATEAVAGSDAVEVRIFRDELARRECAEPVGHQATSQNK